MKERPILFQGAMVRALLAGTKTQTRRAIKPQPETGEGWGGCIRLRFKDRKGDLLLDEALHSPEPHTYLSFCPYGQPGDRLWVKETHVYVGPGSGSDLPSYVEQRKDPANHKPEHCWYRADGERSITWTPSIHMYRGLSRITLEITDVRVERLQTISNLDAMDEGIEPWGGPLNDEWRNYLNPVEFCLTARASYQTLWDSINCAGSWDANPWVWVVEFKRC